MVSLLETIFETFRLERNFDERVGVVAVNRVHHGVGVSFVELPTLPADD